MSDPVWSDKKPPKKGLYQTRLRIADDYFLIGWAYFNDNGFWGPQYSEGLKNGKAKAVANRHKWHGSTQEKEWLNVHAGKGG